ASVAARFLSVTTSMLCLATALRTRRLNLSAPVPLNCSMITFLGLSARAARTPTEKTRADARRLQIAPFIHSSLPVQRLQFLRTDRGQTGPEDSHFSSPSRARVSIGSLRPPAFGAWPARSSRRARG